MLLSIQIALILGGTLFHVAKCTGFSRSSVDSVVAAFRSAALAPIYIGQVHLLQYPLSNSVGGQRPIRSTTPRVDRPVSDYSIDHPPADASHGDQWTVFNSDS